jgi:hypothetical protein
MHWLVRRSKFAVLPIAKARVMATFRAMQETPLAVFEANSQALMEVGSFYKADVRGPVTNDLIVKLKKNIYAALGRDKGLYR